MIKTCPIQPSFADLALSSHLTLPENPRSLHSCNMGAANSMPSKSDPKITTLKAFKFTFNAFVTLFNVVEVTMRSPNWT